MSGLSEKDEGNYTCSSKDDRGVVSNVTHYLRIMCTYTYLHWVYKSYCMHYSTLALAKSQTIYEIISSINIIAFYYSIFYS